jgi:CHAT domain-containing protein
MQRRNLSWKVPDQQTQELMTEFYRHLLAGTPRADALREAQLMMKKTYPNPLSLQRTRLSDERPYRR